MIQRGGRWGGETTIGARCIWWKSPGDLPEYIILYSSKRFRCKQAWTGPNVGSSLRTPPRLVEIYRAPHPNTVERSSRIYINTGAIEMGRDGFSLDYYLACYSL